VKVCADRRETLLLEIHGELSASEQPAWQKHLESCSACRRERQELMGLLKAVTDAMPLPTVSPESARTLRDSVTTDWTANRARGWRGGLFFGMSLRPVPALVAAGLVLAVLGWFGFQGLRSTSYHLRGPETHKQVVVSDAEVIENLDFLEQMKEIEQVVKVVDHRGIRL
jgi:anti-sigma factor RsiW